MKGYIYKITNADESIVYIGSTTRTMPQRWKNHKSCFKRWLEGEDRCHAMIYHYFKEFGIDNFTIKALSEHDIDNKNQLLEFEQLVIDQTECCNKYRSIRTEEQQQEYDRQYYEANRERKLKYQLEYSESNRGAIRAKKNEKVQCDCGMTTSRSNKAAHKRSKKHQQWQQSQS